MVCKASNRFGRTLRQLREGQGIGLRRLAAEIGISATYLSQIELGVLPPPRAEKIEALARVLGREPDALVVLAGRIPSDVIKGVQRHPVEIASLVRATRGMSARNIAALAAQVRGASRTG